MRKLFLIVPVALLFILVTSSSVLAAPVKTQKTETRITSPKPSPKNFGQGVKQLRKETNTQRRELKQEKKAGTVTKEQFKTKKKELQQNFKTEKKELKQEFKAKLSPRPSPKPKK